MSPKILNKLLKKAITNPTYIYNVRRTFLNNGKKLKQSYYLSQVNHLLVLATTVAMRLCAGGRFHVDLVNARVRPTEIKKRC